MNNTSSDKLTVRSARCRTFEVFFGCLLVSLLSADVLFCGIIRVPEDQPSIQDGINAAIAGDTVLVAPGTYVENVSFRGKEIVVVSHYVSSGDTAYIGATIIDGSNPSNPDMASCIVFNSGENRGAILQGFTITGGQGTKWVDPQFPDYTWRGGGGIFSFRSSPTIQDNVIIDNEVINMTGVDGAQGGGILCYGGNPLIRNNTITSNRAGYGGGVVIDYSGGTIEYNIISRNAAVLSYGGGAFWSIGTGPAPIIFENNTVVDNSSEISAGAMYLMGGSPARARNNIFWGNTQASGEQFAGALTVTFSDVEGSFLGEGNIDADPLFADEHFNLSENSPCIDAGDPNSPLDPDGTRADMGARIYRRLDAPLIRVTDYTLDDSEGNGNGMADANETVNLIVTLGNTRLDAIGVSASLTTDDPDVQIIQGTADFGDLRQNQTAINDANPFSFFVGPDVSQHNGEFRVIVTADGGYTTTATLTLLVGNPPIMLVDDDEGALYEDYYIEPLESMQIFPAVWDVSLSGCPTTAELQSYEVVIWFTGDDRESTLNAEEQSALGDFLNSGGRLLISGQDIGYDLAGEGSVDDSMFYAKRFRAEFDRDSSNCTMTIGVSGDPITDGLFVYLTGPAGGADNQTAPDAISAIPPAETLLKYIPGLTGAGLRYEEESTGARLVYLAFGFEGIAGPQSSTAVNLLEKILAWLQGTTPVMGREKGTSMPTECFLSQNYPNPFNPITGIRYSIAHSSAVELRVYDVTGREVATLVQKTQHPGAYEITFDGSDLPSGIYIYRINIGDFSASRRMLLIK